MNVNWLKPNLYVVENGKLVPRPTTPEQKKKNYRYIPYDPLNNPAPEDYFRETISRLQKQNTTLKNELSQKLQQEESRSALRGSSAQAEEIRGYQNQITMLRREIVSKDQQLKDKSQQLVHKDKQILEISNQNTRLHIRINGVMKQIQSLNKLMSKKDQQISNKKQQIQQYCRTLEKLAVKEKQEEKTNFSENYLMTPKIEEKQEEDEFYSFDNYSLRDRHSIDKRYMTPQIQIRLDDSRQYIYRSEKQPDQHNFRSARNSRIIKEEDNKSVKSIEMKDSLKNLNNIVNMRTNGKLSVLDLVKEQVDPVAGGFSSMLPSKR